MCRERESVFREKFSFISPPLRELLLVSPKSGFIPIFGMFFYIRVLVAADGIVAPAAVHAGVRPYKLCVQQFHGRKVHITQGGHNIRKTVPYSKLRCRARRKFIINRLVGFVRRNRHLVIVPFVAAAFRTNKRLVHQLPPERLVAVHKFQLAESRKNQIFLHLFDFTERSNCFADHIIAHDGDAVIGAAYAVVEVLFAAQVGAPVGEKDRVLPLHLFPYCLPLCFRIVQGDFLPVSLSCKALNTAHGFCGRIEARCPSSDCLPPCSFLRA